MKIIFENHKTFLFITLSTGSVTHNHIIWTKRKIQVISKNFIWQEPVWHNMQFVLSFAKRFAQVFAKVEIPGQVRMETFWCNASKQWEVFNNRAKWSFQKKTKLQIIFSSSAKMIFSFFLSIVSFSVWAST